MTTKKHGRVKVYYWPTEERGKTYLLKGKKTISQKVEFLFRHIKTSRRIPRAHLHLGTFKDGYAIFDREGCRLVYGNKGWQRTAPFIQVETMHTATDYDA
jgi:hypothetical protein